MKRIFFSIAFVHLYFVANVQGFAQEVTNYGYRACDGPASSSQYLLPGLPGMVTHAVREEKRQAAFHGSFPVLMRFPLVALRFNADTGSDIKIHYLMYLFYAGCQIERLSGADIIYPFDYFL